MAKFCTLCGKKVEDDQIYCPYCGEKVEGMEPKSIFEEERVVEVNENVVKNVIQKNLQSNLFLALPILYTCIAVLSFILSAIATVYDGEATFSIGNIIIAVVFWCLYGSAKNSNDFNGETFRKIGTFFKVLFVIMLVIAIILAFALIFPMIGIFTILYAISPAGASIVLIVFLSVILVFVFEMLIYYYGRNTAFDLEKMVDVGIKNTKAMGSLKTILIIEICISLFSTIMSLTYAGLIESIGQEANVDFNTIISGASYLSLASSLLSLSGSIVLVVVLSKIKKEIDFLN